MPANAVALAFAASIYPPAVAAVIALGRGPQLRSRVFAFVAAAFVITTATGAVMLFLLEELGATSTTNRTASSALYLALGILLIALASRLWINRPRPGSRAVDAGGPSKIERYLRSRRLAALLGITLYVIPSPIFIGAVKTVADAPLSGSSELLDLLALVAVMLWMIELPMLAILIAPGRAGEALGATNRWFAAHGRTVAIIASAATGGYFAAKGFVGHGA
jgi:hypothetical protein